MERHRARARRARSGHRPRVLLLIKCLGYGGAEQLMVDVAAHRDSQSFDYEVAYVLAAENALVPFVAATGVPVHALGATSNADLRWTVALRRLLLAGDYDVVHFHLPYAAALGRLVVLSLPRRRRPLLVYTEHNMWEKTEVVVRGLNRLGLGGVHRLIAVSQSVGDALPASLRHRAAVVVHGMDLERAAELRADRDAVRRSVRRELGVPDGEVLVVTVANLRPQKGYDVLLEAARLVAADGAPVRFAAVGRGPQKEELAARHEALGLGQRFQLLGQRSDALRLLAGADVFVLASHYEGLPVAIMEATSVGLPIVSTAVGEVPNILTDGVDALIVPPGDPRALADAVERMAADPDLRTRLAAGALARSVMFDIARAVTRIESIYTELIDSGLIDTGPIDPGPIDPGLVDGAA
ncbi:MAG TPA: glycosyltransferase [Acidimicrobiales bacterium]|nr:glycosyltransferase [Acidimicrobiales bacterium]